MLLLTLKSCTNSCSYQSNISSLEIGKKIVTFLEWFERYSASTYKKTWDGIWPMISTQCLYIMIIYDDFSFSNWVIKCKSLNSSRLSCKVEIILLFPLDIIKCNVWGFIKYTMLFTWKDGILGPSSLLLCKPLWESTAGGCLTWQWEAVINSQ